MSDLLRGLGGLPGGAGNAGGQLPVPQLLLQLLASQQGGLGGLLRQFQTAGFADAANSWIGTGPNMPLGGAQIGEALGHDTIKKAAARPR